MDPFEIAKMQVPGAARRGAKKSLKMVDQMANDYRQQARINAATGKSKIRRVSAPAKAVVTP
jgi:hypothetical protein